MKIHVKPSKITVIGLIVVIIFLLALEIWSIISFTSGKVSRPADDIPYIIIFYLLCDIIAFFNMFCMARSYTFSADGIYVKWNIINKVRFHPWSDFIDNYYMSARINRTHLPSVVFSKKKRQSRVSSTSVISGLYPFSTIGVIIYDDAGYSPKNHPSGVCKSDFMELLQQSNVSVEWNA